MLSAGLLRRGMTAALLAAALPFAPSAIAQGQPPSLKSEVSLITFDFLVVGRDGHPVRDIKGEGVTLRMGGRTRPLATVNMVDVGPNEPPRPVSPLPPPFRRRVQTQEGRAFILVIDNSSIRVILPFLISQRVCPQRVARRGPPLRPQRV